MTIDTGANAHELDVVLAPANASIVVTAADGSRPAAGASILLLPDSVEDRLMPTLIKRAQADKDGRASFDGLLPGFTQGGGLQRKVVMWGEDPNLTQRLASGEEVRATSGQSTMKQIRTVGFRGR